MYIHLHPWLLIGTICASQQLLYMYVLDVCVGVCAGVLRERHACELLAREAGVRFHLALHTTGLVECLLWVCQGCSYGLVYMTGLIVGVEVM